jgi:hypothetical protein
MRILLDECLPAGLRRELTGHEVSTAPQMGWAGLKNGALLIKAVAAGFEVFLTVDKICPSSKRSRRISSQLLCCVAQPTT